MKILNAQSALSAVQRRLARCSHYSVMGFVCFSLIFVSTSCAALYPSSPAQTDQSVLYLFVQTARSGTLTPVNTTTGIYRLTLENLNPRVVFFSDRPERDTGSMSIENYLREVFEPSLTSPNAALVIQPPDSSGDQFTVALELSEPNYDLTANVMTYRVRPLENLSRGLAHLDSDPLAELPSSFGNAELFIDSSDIHRCNFVVNNSTDLDFELIKGDTDPPTTSDKWAGGPDESIPAKSQASWHFRFHSNTNMKVGSVKYNATRGSASYRIEMQVTCEADSGKASLISGSSFCNTNRDNQLKCTLSSKSATSNEAIFTITER